MDLIGIAKPQKRSWLPRQGRLGQNKPASQRRTDRGGGWVVVVQGRIVTVMQGEGAPDAAGASSWELLGLGLGRFRGKTNCSVVTIGGQ